MASPSSSPVSSFLAQQPYFKALWHRHRSSCFPAGPEDKETVLGSVTVPPQGGGGLQGGGGGVTVTVKHPHGLMSLKTAPSVLHRAAKQSHGKPCHVLIYLAQKA